MKFEAFQKIPRLKKECVITEKLDGTNAQIFIHNWDTFSSEYFANIPEDCSFTPGQLLEKAHLAWDEETDKNGAMYEVAWGKDWLVRVGSRNRYLNAKEDNYGFYRWVDQNLAELLKLGPGRHFGEWWGYGIQRQYGLAEKRFSLFNTGRWNEDATLPAVCHVVPVLYKGDFDTGTVDGVMRTLKLNGSKAAPGFMNPEGVIIYHAASRQLFKKTFDDNHKEFKDGNSKQEKVGAPEVVA